jgi:hypothetical protein
MSTSLGFILEAVFELAQKPAHTHTIYIYIYIYLNKVILIFPLWHYDPFVVYNQLPIVKFSDPARFLCTDSVQLRSMMGQTVMLHW